MTHNLTFDLFFTFWWLGLALAIYNCFRMSRAPLRESLPFPHHNDEPDEFTAITWMCSSILFLMLVVAPPVFAYSLLALQNEVIWRKESVALVTSENLIIFWISAIFLAFGLYSAIYQNIVNRHSDYEIHRAFWNYRNNVPLWDINELNALVRMQRKRNAAFLAIMWFFAGGNILLGFDSYVEVVPQGMNVNGFWSVGAKRWPWREFQSGDLHIQAISGGGRTNSTTTKPRFRVLTNWGQPIDIIGAATCVLSQPLTPAYATAQLMRGKGLPVTVCALPPSWRNRTSLERYNEAQKLWRDISALPGVKVYVE